MNQAELNYSVCEKKDLAVIFSLKKFRHILLFTMLLKLVTDPQALHFAFKKKVLHGKLAGGLNVIADYKFNIVYWRRFKNVFADKLSHLSSSCCRNGRGVCSCCHQGPIYYIGMWRKTIFNISVLIQSGLQHNWENNASIGLEIFQKFCSMRRSNI